MTHNNKSQRQKALEAGHRIQKLSKELAILAEEGRAIKANNIALQTSNERLRQLVVNHEIESEISVRQLIIYKNTIRDYDHLKEINNLDLREPKVPIPQLYAYGYPRDPRDPRDPTIDQ